MDKVEKLIFFLKESPNDSFLQHVLALEYIKEGKNFEARSLLESILKREPSYIGSYYQLAKLLERNGEITEALEWYEKGLAAAQIAADHKAFNELRAAYEELKA